MGKCVRSVAVFNINSSIYLIEGSESNSICSHTLKFKITWLVKIWRMSLGLFHPTFHLADELWLKVKEMIT